jgi:hypothetical protein
VVAERMGGDHHAHTPKIPDWRIYTVGEHTPELLKNERMLKSLGLKVLRNNLFLISSI